MTDSPPSRDAPPHVLLIDLDNCPQQLSQLPESLEGFTRIVVCYGSQEPKLPLGLVTPLAEPILSGRLDIVGMEKNGKNAADFGLSFHAGRLMAEMPPETEFTVLSEDGDLDHAVNLLRAHGRTARRVNGKPANGKRTPDPSVLAVAAKEYAAHNLQTGKPRPSREETLLNSVKAYVKNRHAVQPKSVVEWLKSTGRLDVTRSGKVQYPDVEPDMAGKMPGTAFDDDIPF
jgi:hypothetical protein